MKKFISIIITLAISMTALVSLPISANDYQTKEDALLEFAYEYADYVTSSLAINGYSANCKSTTNGGSDVTRIVATQYLEKKTMWWWSTDESWSGSSNSNSLIMNNSKSGLDSGTYRLRTEFTVYAGSDSETIEKTSSEQTV